MGNNETSADRTSEKPAPDDQVKDQGANPAHPLPGDTATDDPARKVEIDAQIEDRFEASDN